MWLKGQFAKYQLQYLHEAEYWLQITEYQVLQLHAAALSR